MLLLIPTISEAVLLMGEAAAQPLTKGLSARWSVAGLPVTCALCGFGLAASGAGAGYWIGRMANAPNRAFWGGDGSHEAMNSGAFSKPVGLIGLAGSLDSVRAPVGEALIVNGAACEGIGFGTGLKGRGHRGAEEMGWIQGHAVEGAPAIGDALTWPAPPLQAPRAGTARIGHALSVASASGDAREADARVQAWPLAAVEDMETFAVALAARLAGEPLVVVRGVCNQAGDRDKARWRMDDAMAAARELLSSIVDGWAGVGKNSLY